LITIDYYRVTSITLIITTHYSMAFSLRSLFILRANQALIQPSECCHLVAQCCTQCSTGSSPFRLSMTRYLYMGGHTPIPWRYFDYICKETFNNYSKTITKISSSSLYFVTRYGCTRKTNIHTYVVQTYIHTKISQSLVSVLIK
jgi:hypothetical protein